MYANAITCAGLHVYTDFTLPNIVLLFFINSLPQHYLTSLSKHINIARQLAS
jgi:hypothetical protein